MKELNEINRALKRVTMEAEMHISLHHDRARVSAKDILAIAEAFRALEQRTEAAEAEVRKLLKTVYEEKGVALRVVEERDALRAKLAELEKQESKNADR